MSIASLRASLIAVLIAAACVAAVAIMARPAAAQVGIAHACGHFNDDPQAHTAATDVSGAPTLQGTHTLFDISLPADVSYVRYTFAEARGYAFFTGEPAALALSGPDGQLTPTSSSSNVDDCPAIAGWVLFEPPSAGTYTLQISASGQGDLLLLVEEAGGHDHGHGHDDDDHGHDHDDDDHDHSHDDDDHGHGHDDDDHGHSHDDAPAVDSLAPWSGTWVSGYGFAATVEVDALIADVAATVGAPVATVRGIVEDMLETSFEGMTVQGDSVTYSGLANPVTCDYSYIGDTPAEFGGSSFYWHTFETASAGCDPYRFLLLTPPHGEGPGRHFHARYGVANPAGIASDAALAGWYPALFGAKLTVEGFVSSMEGELAAFVSLMLDAGETPAPPLAGSAGLASEPPSSTATVWLAMAGALVLFAFTLAWRIAGRRAQM